MRAALATLILVATAWVAHAADPEPVEIPAAIEAREIVFDLGAGATLSPKFPSSKIYQPGAVPLFGLTFLRLPYFGEVVSDKRTGSAFSLFPSFNYVTERDSSDAAYLRGIPNRDFSLELGPGVAYRYGPVRAYATLRYGFFGSEGFVGDFGANYIAQPVERLTASIGPRVGYATANYMNTYFGVPNSATRLQTYDADGGIKDVGFTIDATYKLTEKVRLVGRLGYRHYVGDALDSPIVKAGNEQEVEIGLGLTYRFGFDLWK